MDPKVVDGSTDDLERFVVEVETVIFNGEARRSTRSVIELI